MNLLAVDIGNSHVTAGIVRDWKVRGMIRIEAGELDSAGARLAELWAEIPGGKNRRIVICSVQPDFLRRLQRQIAHHLGVEPLLVGRDIDFPIKLAIDNPHTVGADRICAAAAAYEQIQAPVAVADFGTAITIDCVDAQGVFLGGTILPGLAMAARALHEQTAGLPLVRVTRPIHTCGQNTEEAISNGVFLGVVGALREIVERFAADLDEWPHLVASGGDAEAIAKECNFVDSLVPDLCLRGVALAYQNHLRRKKARRRSP